MDRYFQKLGVYYDEKIKFLSGKDKFISCNKCDSKKEFKETFEKLVFTCGSKGKCGDQIIITFPKYTHCESTLRELREELNTGLNWTSIHNFLDVSKELEDSEEKNKRINNEILSIEELFYEKNMKIKEKLLQKFYWCPLLGEGYGEGTGVNLERQERRSLVVLPRQRTVNGKRNLQQWEKRQSLGAV